MWIKNFLQKRKEAKIQKIAAIAQKNKELDDDIARRRNAGTLWKGTRYDRGHPAYIASIDG